ncbi:MAG: methyltransferase family protein [Alphaproteobacteria bacterium]
MNWSLIKTIVILPGTALVFVPAAIFWATGDRPAFVSPATAGFWIGLVLALGGIAMAAWTVRLFAGRGQGTPAPWDPPRKLVVNGPYRYVRNPMITSVLAMLAAEALLLDKSAIAAWLVFFFVANSIYFPLSEEKGLERRFGDDYRLYKANVPRWIPRLTPWSQPIDPRV